MSQHQTHIPPPGKEKLLLWTPMFFHFLSSYKPTGQSLTIMLVGVFSRCWSRLVSIYCDIPVVSILSKLIASHSYGQLTAACLAAHTFICSCYAAAGSTLVSHAHLNILLSVVLLRTPPCSILHWLGGM